MHGGLLVTSVYLINIQVSWEQINIPNERIKEKKYLHKILF